MWISLFQQMGMYYFHIVNTQFLEIIRSTLTALAYSDPVQVLYGVIILKFKLFV